jgi:RecB family endonuclease NucS
VLRIELYSVISDSSWELGFEPGLVKDGVERDLQELLAANVGLVEPESVLVRREYFTAIGPVDMLLSSRLGGHIAVELKRVGDIAGVEQLTRYLELLNRDSLLAPVRGVFAAQTIVPQARTLAEDRGIACLVLDYDGLRGLDDGVDRLF